MAEYEIDIDETHDYLEWLEEKLDEEELAELERDAAAGFVGDARTFAEWADVDARLRTRLSLSETYWYLRDLERGETLSRRDELQLWKALTELRRDYPRLDGDDPHAWRAFLADHPALEREPEPKETDQRSVSGERGREFADDDVFAALVAACEATAGHNERSRGRVWTSDVARTLTAGRGPTRSELVRAGQALGRLERAGRVLDATRRGDGAPMWTFAGA